MNAIDTNVLVYAVDFNEPTKQAKAIDLLNRLSQPPTETVLLWQVVGEYLSCLRRWQSAGRVTDTLVEQYVNRALAMFSLTLPTQNVIALSLALSSRYSLSHWDSMLLAACTEAGVDTLYSEDLDASMTYDSVTVVNPFV
jgi:predicted nucleic acid-binding protein